MSQINYKISDDTIATTLDGTVVMLHIDTGRYYSLDKVGALAWEGLSEQLPLPDITKLVLKEYDVDEDTANADLHDLLNELAEIGMIETVNTE